MDEKLQERKKRERDREKERKQEKHRFGRRCAFKTSVDEGGVKVGEGKRSYMGAN